MKRLKMLILNCICLSMFLCNPAYANNIVLPSPDWGPAVEIGLERVLRAPNGLLYTRNDKKTFLSETHSLEMELAALRGDLKRFKTLVSLMQKYFVSPSGLLAWELSSTGKKATSNASIDDLRTCYALLLADELWPKENFKKPLITLAEKIRIYNTENDTLLDGASWKQSWFKPLAITKNTNELTLSYADLRAMKMLAKRDENWLPILVKTSGFVITGLFLEEKNAWGYSFEKKEFTYNEENLINTMLHLHFLSSIGIIPTSYGRKYAIELLSTGKITDKSGNENITVYALASLFFKDCGFDEAAEKAYSKLSDFIINEGKYKGLLGYEQEDKTQTVWAFDNLIALIARELLYKIKIPM